jgi:hypothetical protein
MDGQRHAPAALPPGRRPSTHCIVHWVGPRAGLDGCGNLAFTGIRSPDRPAGSESLYYRLSWLGLDVRAVLKRTLKKSVGGYSIGTGVVMNIWIL